MNYKWYWHEDKPIQVLARKGIIGDYWIIPELKITVAGTEIFDTVDACIKQRFGTDTPNTEKSKEEEKDIGRPTWIPYLRVIDGKKK